MILTEEKIKEIFILHYEKYTGRRFPYNGMQFRKRVLEHVSARVVADGFEATETLFRVSKIPEISFHSYVFPEGAPSKYSVGTLRQIILHELAHLLRMEELNFIVDIVEDTHDKRWFEIMKALGVNNPTAKTELVFKV